MCAHGGQEGPGGPRRSQEAQGVPRRSPGDPQEDPRGQSFWHKFVGHKKHRCIRSFGVIKRLNSPCVKKSLKFIHRQFIHRNIFTRFSTPKQTNTTLIPKNQYLYKKWCRSLRSSIEFRLQNAPLGPSKLSKLCNCRIWVSLGSLLTLDTVQLSLGVFGSLLGNLGTILGLGLLAD